MKNYLDFPRDERSRTDILFMVRQRDRTWLAKHKGKTVRVMSTPLVCSSRPALRRAITNTRRFNCHTRLVNCAA